MNLEVTEWEDKSGEGKPVKVWQVNVSKGGKSTQSEVFQQGMILRKISENVYFNRGEIVECVGFYAGAAYFTCDRLRRIHAGDHVSGVSPLPGIVLKEGEVFERISQNTLLVEQISRRLNFQERHLASMMDELTKNKKRVAELREQIERQESDIWEMEEAVLETRKVLDEAKEHDGVS